jgi:ABC-type enterochelin transport system substrate-binding protein
MILKKIAMATLGILSYSCQNQKSDENHTAQQMPESIVVNDTIPTTRIDVNPKAVASHHEKVNDPLNDWRFAIDLYETPHTFDYLLTIEYKSLHEKDTIHIPNFGIQPKVVIQKGEVPLSCIIGFHDKIGVFMPYKKIAVTGGQLKITTVRSYSRTRYKMK